MAQEQLIQSLEQLKNQQPQVVVFNDDHMALLQECILESSASSTPSSTSSEGTEEIAISDEKAIQALQILAAYCQTLLGESGDYSGENLDQEKLTSIAKTALLLRCKHLEREDYTFPSMIANLFFHCLQKEDSFCYSLSESNDEYQCFYLGAMVDSLSKKQFLTVLGLAGTEQAKILANDATSSQRFQKEAQITDVLETATEDDGSYILHPLTYGELTRYVKQDWFVMHMATINRYKPQDPMRRHFYRLLNQHLAAKKINFYAILNVDELWAASDDLLKAWVATKDNLDTKLCKTTSTAVNTIPNLDSKLQQLNKNLQSNPAEEKSEEALINPFNALLQHLVDNSWAKWFGINSKIEEACRFFKALNEAPSHCQRLKLIHAFEFREITSKNDNEAYQKLVKLQSACQQLGPTAGYWDEFKATRLAVLLKTAPKELTKVEQQLKEKLSEQPESQPAATSSVDI